MPKISEPASVRFWRKVKVRRTNECWPWVGGRCTVGYGRFTKDKSRKIVGAHRFAYESKNGEIPAGLFVLHTCDNPSCCNPAHLTIGTARDNTQDCIRKGRFHPYRGGVPRDRNGRTKIPSASIPVIVGLRRAGITLAQIARRFGVTRQAITYILRRNSACV